MCSAMKAAILMTCFNRKQETLRCLKSIYSQKSVEAISYDIYLVDDASSDGTADAIAAAYPNVKLLKGDGSCYWNGGMNLAWKAAAEHDYEYYIWINDDVSIGPDAFKDLFSSYAVGVKKSGGSPVIVGCFSEQNSDAHAYGGFSVVRGRWTNSTKRLLPTGEVTACDTFNGNLVLVPRKVVKEVGFLDPQFTHSIGDKDYGYRCMRKGLPMYITPEYIGTCSRNSIGGSWTDPKVPLHERYKKLLMPTGLPPGECFYSARKNRGVIAACIAITKLYARMLMPRAWSRISARKSGE